MDIVTPTHSGKLVDGSNMATTSLPLIVNKSIAPPAMVKNKKGEGGTAIKTTPLPK